MAMLSVYVAVDQAFQGSALYHHTAAEVDDIGSSKWEGLSTKLFLVASVTAGIILQCRVCVVGDGGPCLEMRLRPYRRVGRPYITEKSHKMPWHMPNKRAVQAHLMKGTWISIPTPAVVIQRTCTIHKLQRARATEAYLVQRDLLRLPHVVVKIVGAAQGAFLVYRRRRRHFYA